ncbi:MAG TPA: hypothetical protein DEF51_39160, partial [Myxococcales bacterium]|nr:hypothetical protein [Myxococcales bacterium]
KLDESERDRLMLSEAAIERHELSPRDLEGNIDGISERYHSVFEQPGAGFDIPLITGGTFAGVLSVEYEPDLTEPRFDRSLIVPLAVQLGASLRNAR